MPDLPTYTWPDVPVITADFWGHEDREVLTSQTLDDELDATLGQYAQWTPVEYPETVEITAYRRISVADHPALDPRAIVEGLLERLNEDYDTSPDGQPSTPTPTLLAAAAALAAAIVAEYEPWSCEPIAVVTVPVAAWLAAHPEEGSDA